MNFFTTLITCAKNILYGILGIGIFVLCIWLFIFILEIFLFIIIGYAVAIPIIFCYEQGFKFLEFVGDKIKEAYGSSN